MISLSKDMETGVEKIDAQHMELVNRINAVLSMGHNSLSKEEVQKTLKLLEDYTVKHFSDEEALQKQHNYPKYEWHKSQHQLFIAEIKKLENEYANNGYSDIFTLNLNNSIINWIIKHIKSADVELGKFIKGSTGQ
jgi:hemerythrin